MCTTHPSAAGRLALAALTALLLTSAASAAEGPPAPERVETDDEALRAIAQAVKARDVEALLERVSPEGVDRADSMIGRGWFEKNLPKEGGPLHDWVFGPKPAKGQAAKGPAPFSMAACLAGEVKLSRRGLEPAAVPCSKGTDSATVGLQRFGGRWYIVRDFFFPY